MIYSNSVLFSRVLTNESRAKNSVLELKLRVAIGTPHCLIKALETKMRKFVEQRPMDFVKDSFSVVVYHVQPGESIDVSPTNSCFSSNSEVSGYSGVSTRGVVCATSVHEAASSDYSIALKGVTAPLDREGATFDGAFAANGRNECPPHQHRKATPIRGAPVKKTAKLWHASFLYGRVSTVLPRCCSMESRTSLQPANACL